MFTQSVGFGPNRQAFTTSVAIPVTINLQNRPTGSSNSGAAQTPGGPVIVTAQPTPTVVPTSTLPVAPGTTIPGTYIAPYPGSTLDGVPLGPDDNYIAAARRTALELSGMALVTAAAVGLGMQWVMVRV